MIGLGLAFMAIVLAAVPAALFCANVRRYLPAPNSLETGLMPRVSVLIPARNEAHGIESALRAVLANEQVDLEAIVLDDESTDATAAIVTRIAECDARVRLERASALPAGWCGKQHACHLLANHAKAPYLLFIDADVRMHSRGVVRAIAALEQSRASLVSGFPRQITDSWFERLVIPLMHFVLLGFLPLGRMRANLHPAYGAGCGQLILVRREDYWTAGGHRSIRASLHDGLQLPRALRTAGYATDLFDATDIADCRMYRNAGQVWRGLAKNAHEGLASPATILPATIALVGGQVLPFVLVALFLAGYLELRAGWLAVVAAGLALAPRLIAARLYRQSWSGAFGHPLGVFALVSIQWWAFFKRVCGHSSEWKGRSYGVGATIASSEEQCSLPLDVDRSVATPRLR